MIWVNLNVNKNKQIRMQKNILNKKEKKIKSIIKLNK